MNVRAAVVLSAALIGAGCHGCHEDHPYVPYTIGATEPTLADAGSPAAAVALPDAAHVAFAGDPALVAPAGLARWTIGDVALEAPEGDTFLSAIVRDFDGDAVADAFAVVHEGTGNDPGQLAYFHGKGSSVALAGPVMIPRPEGLAWDVNCTPADRLLAIGPHSVTVEIGASCPAHVPGAPDRWIAVVSAGPGAGAVPVAGPRVMLATELFDPSGAPSLSVDADVDDRDGDGVHDVALRVTLEGGGFRPEPAPRVSAVFAWVDRPAGLSQDLSATQASLATLASQAAARAARAKEAAGVPAFVGQARELWRAVCADGGSPRVVGVTGIGPVACGTSRALEDLGMAEVRAYASLGDPLRAALSLDLAERPPATHTPARATEGRRWIAQDVDVVNIHALRAIAAVPLSSASREPAWGSLAFEPSGRLLVRTRAGLVRVDPEAGDEVQASGVADWRAAVTSPDGALRWTDTYDPCTVPGLHAAFACTAGDCTRDVAIPVAPPLGGRCVGGRGASVHVLPIAWGPAGIEAVVENEIVWVSPDLTHTSPSPDTLGQPYSPGSPRSPGGAALVVPTGAGIFVRGSGRARLLRAPELEATYGEQRDCVVSDDEAHVACVRAGSAWVGSF
ncbi:MAG TPA: hypothetical protein VGM06_07180 [Polyangiaceae bacterium]|jgi:hypothetical protein